MARLDQSVGRDSIPVATTSANGSLPQCAPDAQPPPRRETKHAFSWLTLHICYNFARQLPPITMNRRRLFVTTALPYANGPFHIGPIMESIQADIWRRFHRMP